MMSALLAITALQSALLVAVCWALYAVIRQNGRVLLRLEALEAERPLARSRLKRDGLAAGTRAPEFHLPTVDGGQAELADYAGRWLLLVFSDPECAPCTALLPRLASAARDAQLDLLLVGRGDAEANRRKLAEAGVDVRVALQSQWEISRLYAMFATPVGYLIDPHGRIAEPVAAGATAILGLTHTPRHIRTRRPEAAASRQFVH
jgi:peroxiredoxin